MRRELRTGRVSTWPPNASTRAWSRSWTGGAVTRTTVAACPTRVARTGAVTAAGAGANPLPVGVGLLEQQTENVDILTKTSRRHALASVHAHP